MRFAFGPSKRGIDSGLYGRHATRGHVSGPGGHFLKKRTPSSCTPEYEKLGHSTMCEYEDDPEAKNMGKANFFLLLHI